MYGIQEGEPFQVYVRRGSAGPNLVIRFECKEGMGILGIRKTGRTDPAPASAYEEEDIEPASLRAGRFVHVLGNGQRQSYALSRISGEIASRLPADAWVELKPQTEYGFRYLVAPDDAPANGAAAPAAAEREPERAADPGADSTTPRRARTPPPSGQTPVSPPLAEAMLARLPKEQAIEYLRAEMARVHDLQRHIEELEEALVKSRSRERDLLDVLTKWQDEG